MEIGVPAFPCKLWAPHIVPSAASWVWAPLTNSLQAGELSFWHMWPQGRPWPCPPTIHPAARRTITSLAPVSSVHLPRDVRDEPSSKVPAWPPSHPARRARTALRAWPPVPRPNPSPAIASISAQHAALPGVVGLWGNGVPGVGWRMKVDEEERGTVPSPASPQLGTIVLGLCSDAGARVLLCTVSTLAAFC